MAGDTWTTIMGVKIIMFGDKSRNLQIFKSFNSHELKYLRLAIYYLEFGIYIILLKTIH